MVESGGRSRGDVTVAQISKKDEGGVRFRRGLKKKGRREGEHGCIREPYSACRNQQKDLLRGSAIRERGGV